MMYNGYPYGIFDLNYLNTHRMLQEAQRQWEQNKNLADLTKALSDFLDAYTKVHPDYQQAALNTCATLILDHMAKYNGGNQT